MKNRQEELYQEWMEAREYKNFVRDGILNYDKWKIVDPKILFLLKETADDFINISDREIDVTKGNGTHFWWNICYWKFIINSYLEKTEPQFVAKHELPEIKLNNNILDSIAYINIKKQCDNRTKSKDNEILNYAIADKELLKKHIDLINPNIVFCSKVTFKAYKIIYQSELEKLNEICYRHKNRLILNFRHPSFFQIAGGRKAIFNELKQSFVDGDIFKQFKWS